MKTDFQLRSQFLLKGILVVALIADLYVCQVQTTNTTMPYNTTMPAITSANSSNSTVGGSTTTHSLIGNIQWPGESKYIHGILLLLFADKDAQWRHNIKPPGLLKINISLVLHRILDLDEKTQILTLSVWRKLQFFNEHLKWNPADFGNIENIRIPDKYLWAPDITLWNNIDDEDRQLLRQVMATVTSNGHVTLNEPLLVKANCKLDIRLYPFDDHKCQFLFGSWIYGIEFLDINPDNSSNDGGANTEQYLYNNVWRLLKFSSSDGQASYHEDTDGNPASFSIVTFTIEFDRRWLLPFVYLVLPNLLINIMCIFGFLLPCDSNEKVGLSVTLFLSMVVYLLLFYQLLPFTETVPVLVLYLLWTIVGVTITLIMNIIVLQFHHRGNHDNSLIVPLWARHLFLHQISRWVGFGKSIVPDADHFRKMDVNIDVLEVLPEDGDELIHDMQAGLFNVNKNSNIPDKHEGSNTYMLNVKEASGDGRPARRSVWEAPRLSLKRGSHTAWQNRMSLLRSDLRNNQDILLYRILKHCEDFKEHLLENDRFYEVKMEWKQLAMVLDRMLFLFYIFVTFLSFIYLLANVPWGQREYIK